jgi:hypothetical protein
MPPHLTSTQPPHALQIQMPTSNPCLKSNTTTSPLPPSTSTHAYINADGVPVFEAPKSVLERVETKGDIMVWMDADLIRYLVAKQNESAGAESVGGLNEELLSLRLVDRFSRAPVGGDCAEAPVFRDVVYEREG